MTDGTVRRFGLDAVGFDDRLRLFSFATSDNRLEYLWILRAIDAARSNYQVVLSTEAVARDLETMAEHHPECPQSADVDLAARLDMLVEWGILDRTQDATRAATLTEYRRRHSVYQFTEAGHRVQRGRVGAQHTLYPQCTFGGLGSHHKTQRALAQPVTARRRFTPIRWNRCIVATGAECRETGAATQK